MKRTRDNGLSLKPAAEPQEIAARPRVYATRSQVKKLGLNLVIPDEQPAIPEPDAMLVEPPLHDDDGDYTPKAKYQKTAPGNKGNVMNFRTRKTYQDEKTYAYALGLSEQDQQTLNQAFATAIPTHCEEVILGSPSPYKGRPKYVIADGIRLDRSKDHVEILFYSNIPADTLHYKNSLELSPSSPGSQQTQHFDFTKAFLDGTEAERQKCNDKRNKTQKQVMGESAADAAEGFMEPGDRLEWLHLIAWALLAARAQKKENLVAGLNHPNTDMIPVERQIRKIAEKYPNTPFSLDVTAHLFKGTKVSKSIDYTITTPAGKFCFRFNTWDRVKPSRANDTYIETLFDLVLNETITLLDEKDISSPVKQKNANKFTCSLIKSDARKKLNFDITPLNFDITP